MKYLSVAEMAKKWNVSERTVRNYCAQGRIPNAFLTGKTWNIPEDAQRPERSNKKTDELKNLFEFLRAEKTGGVKGGIEHGETDDFSYNVAKDPVHINDLNATILQLMGIDHRKFSFKFQGLDQRLTGVEEHHPVKAVLA